MSSDKETTITEGIASDLSLFHVALVIHHHRPNLSDVERTTLFHQCRPDLSSEEVAEAVRAYFPDQEHIDKLLKDDNPWHPLWSSWRQKNPDLVPRLTGARLQNLSLQDIRLQNASLGTVNFRHSDLYGANLSRAYCQMADFLNARLRTAVVVETDLSFATLSECDCSKADLRGANLCGAAFYNTNFKNADLRGANVKGAVFDGANFTGANLSGLDFRGVDKIENSIFVGTDLRNANLSGCRVYGIAAWDVNLDGTIQRDLVITPADEPTISVDSLEVAQFIYLLLNNQKIRHVIDTITSKVVLILGRFTPDRKPILDAIRDELRKRDYLPVLFDFEKPSNRDITETVSTLAHMARFVIADITDAKSIPQELMAIVPTLPSVPVQPLLLASQQEYGMFEHFKRFAWVLEPFLYEDQSRLLAAITDKVIGPAEAKVKERTQR